MHNNKRTYTPYVQSVFARILTYIPLDPHSIRFKLMQTFSIVDSNYYTRMASTEDLDKYEEIIYMLLYQSIKGNKIKK